MSVKTWLIGAAAVVVLGGATVVVLGQKDGAQSGTKQTTVKSPADKKESANSNSTKSKDDKVTVIKPFEAAQSSKRQVWLQVSDENYNVTKNSAVLEVVVTQNGQATVYQQYGVDGNYIDNLVGLSLTDLDNLSDDEIINKAKAANYRPLSGKLEAQINTDDTGNAAASEFLTLDNRYGDDEARLVAEADLYTLGNFGTVLTTEYWGFSNNDGMYFVQPVKPGNNPEYRLDDINTKGVKVD